MQFEIFDIQSPQVTSEVREQVELSPTTKIWSVDAYSVNFQSHA